VQRGYDVIHLNDTGQRGIDETSHYLSLLRPRGVLYLPTTYAILYPSQTLV
jgi:hypothetical protein